MNFVAQSSVRFSVLLLSLGGLLACGQKPAQLQLEGEIPKEVYGALPIRLPSATVLDAKGQPIAEAPAIVIESKPSDVAMIQDNQLVPIKDGKVEVRYRIPDTSIQSVHNVVVSLIDRVELECPEEGCDLSSGQKVSMKPRFMRGQEKLDNVKAQWTSSSPEVVAVDDQGNVEAKGGGNAEVTVKVGVFEAKVTVNVVGTADPDKLVLGCKKENVNVFDEAGGCVIRMGVPMEMELHATAKGSPVRVPTLEWSQEEPVLVGVSQGRRAEVVGKALGHTVVTAKHGEVQASLALEVVPAPCSESSVESFKQPMGKQDSINLTCKMEEAQNCFNHYVDKKKPQQAAVDKALERCCCEIRESAQVEEAAAPSGE